MGLLLGRIANFINGELYGRAANVPWAVQFPKELIDSTTIVVIAMLLLSGYVALWDFVMVNIVGALTK